MKNLNAIIILATVAGMATLTACSSTKPEEEAVPETKEAAVPAETTAETPAPGPGMGMMGPGMGGFGGGMGMMGPGMGGGMGGFGGGFTVKK